MATPGTGPAAPKSDYNDHVGGGQPSGGPHGTPATDRHVDAGQGTDRPPTVTTKGVDRTDAVKAPNDQGTTNTREQNAMVAKRYRGVG